MIPRVGNQIVTAIRPGTWNQIADSVNASIAPGFNAGTRSSMNGVGLQWVYAHNSGDDRAAYECSGLDIDSDPTLDVSPDGNLVPVVTATDDDDPRFPTLVWIEPAASGSVSRAVLTGLALALVAPSEETGELLVRDGGKLSLDSSGTIRTMFPPNTEEDRLCLVDLTSAAGGGRLFMTPSTGIPAKVGDKLSSAMCTPQRMDDGGNLEDSGDSEPVFNSVASPIPGGVLIQAKRIGSHWFCDVVDCEPSAPAPLEQPSSEEMWSEPDSMIAIEIEV